MWSALGALAPARLLGFPMQRVLATARAILVQLEPPRVVSLVLPRAVRTLLAGGARQCDHGSVLGLGHVRRSSSSPLIGHGTLRPVTGGKLSDSRCGDTQCQRDSGASPGLLPVHGPADVRGVQR